MYKNIVKPLLDFVVALIMFAAISPIFILIAIFLTFANNGNPFFIQKRPGKNERIFNIFKFKTMNENKDESGALLSDEERLTSVGSFVRKTSLDEIPQLLNVIKGDMSFVGPRPLLVRYLPLYNSKQSRRHGVKPGISGWAQVMGRNAITWEKKFELDVWYVENQSFLLDLKILLKTVRKVIFKEDINAEGFATTTPFTGKK